MSRFLLTLFSVTALATGVHADEPKPTSKFEKEIRLPSNIGFSPNVATDGQALTVLFENVVADLDFTQQGAIATHNQTAIETKVCTVNIPYATDQRSVTMAMDLRGFVDADPGAIIRLVACAGGTTQVVDLSTDESNTVKLKGTSKETIVAEHPGEEYGNFQDRVEFTVQTHAAKPVCQVTLFLVVERNTDSADSGGALLAMDSMDISIAKPSKATLKP